MCFRNVGIFVVKWSETWIRCRLNEHGLQEFERVALMLTYCEEMALTRLNGRKGFMYPTLRVWNKNSVVVVVVHFLAKHVSKPLT